MTWRILIAAFLMAFGMLVVPTSSVSVQGKVLMGDGGNPPLHIVAPPPSAWLAVEIADGGGGEPPMAPDGGGGEPPMAPAPVHDWLVAADGGGGEPPMAPPPMSDVDA